MNENHNHLRGTGNLIRVASAALVFLLAAIGVARASGIVSDCTESALNTALSGGGTVTFACDGVITLTGPKTVSANTVLDASGRDVTLNGFFGPNSTNATRLFFVNTNISFTLINLKLVNGRATNGAAIYNNGGTLVATNCVFAFVTTQVEIETNWG